MIHKFLPHTGEDIQQMLDRIGIKKLEDLYAVVPSYIEALAISIPVSSAIILWNSKI